MKKILVAAVLGVSAMAFTGCESRHEEGVSSTYRSQRVDVNANPEEATDAARAVLEDQGLKNVTSNATNVDGMASGRMADGTVVKVIVKKAEGGNGSDVRVTVGTIGDPALGADLAKKIAQRAGGDTLNTNPNRDPERNRDLDRDRDTGAATTRPSNNI
jgi:hypothetical protein